jgi:hypothetical protein
MRIAAGLFALVLAGCGGTAGRPEPVPAGGKVTYKKTTPPAGALVVFHPTDAEFEKRIGGKPFATVKDDGTFVLSMYATDDGAPEGEYGVTIDWQKRPKELKLSLGGEGGGGASVLNPKYSSPAKPFTKVTVKKGGDNQFTFDVD